MNQKKLTANQPIGADQPALQQRRQKMGVSWALTYLSKPLHHQNFFGSCTPVHPET